MGEIRFVGTGETRGYPYLVCKKTLILTLKAPITTAADGFHKYFFIVFQRKYDLKFQLDSHEKSSLIFFER